MMMIWREIGLFKITEKGLADQTRVIRINGDAEHIPEVKLEEIHRKTKEGENMEELRIELQNAYDEETPNEELDAELMNIENVLSELQDQGLDR